MNLRFLLYLLATLGVSGCGQPGPLYLPDNPPPGMKVPVEEGGDASLPEREIDQAPTPIEINPKTRESQTQEATPPSENKQ